jgi:hypothetical protein
MHLAARWQGRYRQPSHRMVGICYHIADLAGGLRVGVEDSDIDAILD